MYLVFFSFPGLCQETEKNYRVTSSTSSCDQLPTNFELKYTDENNELRYWLIGSRLANPSLRFAINGDTDTPVYSVKRVFDILQDLNITRFNLITDTEKDAS